MAGGNANQKFDFGRAEQLKSKLQSDVDKISQELQSMMKDVEGVKDWWSGGSEEAFIGNFKDTKDKINKSLNDVIADYKKLIGQIVDIKKQQDLDMANQLKSKR